MIFIKKLYIKKEILFFKFKFLINHYDFERYIKKLFIINILKIEM